MNRMFSALYVLKMSLSSALHPPQTTKRTCKYPENIEKACVCQMWLGVQYSSEKKNSTSKLDRLFQLIQNITGGCKTILLSDHSVASGLIKAVHIIFKLDAESVGRKAVLLSDGIEKTFFV